MTDKSIPPPPTFKTFEDNSTYLTYSFVPNADYKNYEYLDQSLPVSPMIQSVKSDSPSALKPSVSTKKKRRRNTSEEENIERRKELKTQHSIIEKRRRLKINREFDALKYLVPACRENVLEGLLENNNFDNYNNMHKLTILQSTVEYIKYLHFIISLKNPELEFCKVDMDLSSLRNIDKAFDFELLYLKECDNHSKKIIENNRYRREILESQGDDSVFSLPPPAIINKHLDITSPRIKTNKAKLSDKQDTKITSQLLLEIKRRSSIENMLN